MLTTYDKLKELTPQGFAILGMGDIAYVGREVVDGKACYVIRHADGNPIGMAEDREIAFAAVRQHGLDPVSVH
jgi:hypothetical protein